MTEKCAESNHSSFFTHQPGLYVCGVASVSYIKIPQPCTTNRKQHVTMSNQTSD